MSDRAQELERTLRDYPISLRQSARAVFGTPQKPADQHGADDQKGHGQQMPLPRT